MIRAAIIGCGGIAERHGRGFSIPGRCQVVAGVDLDPENLERTCDLLAIPGRYTDHMEMLREEKPDLVSICTWPGTHASLTLDCVEGGVSGILCEKPMAVSPAQCDEMIEACQSAGVFLGTGHHYRFNPGVTAVQRLVASGGLGSILLMCSITRDGLANNTTHLVDTMRCITGNPAPEWAIGQVERITDRYERGEPIEDCALGELGFAGDWRAFLDSDLSGGPNRLLVVGSSGVVRIEAGHAYRQECQGEWPELEPVEAPDQHASFLDWMEGGPTYLSAAENGRIAVECVNALFLSSHLRRRVSFPLASRDYPLPAMIASGELPVQHPGPYDIRAGKARWRNAK